MKNMVSMWHQVIKMSFSSGRHPPNRYLSPDINGVIERDIKMGITAVDGVKKMVEGLKEQGQ